MQFIFLYALLSSLHVVSRQRWESSVYVCLSVCLFVCRFTVYMVCELVKKNHEKHKRKVKLGWWNKKISDTPNIYNAKTNWNINETTYRRHNRGKRTARQTENGRFGLHLCCCCYCSILSLNTNQTNVIYI